MGNILNQNESEKEIEKDITPFPKFINTGKRQLKTSSDFSIEKLKNISLNILNEIKENEDDKSKIKKLEKSIEYDNTNESIIKEYLKCLKKVNQKKYEENLNKYLFHISPETYKLITVEEKKISSKSKLKEIFEIFKNYDNNSIQNKYHILEYFKIENLTITQINSNYKSENHVELSLIELYYLLFKEVNNKIYKLWDLIENNDLTINEKLSLFYPISKHSFINLILNHNSNKNYVSHIIIFYSITFIHTFNYLQKYINSIYKIIEECLEMKKKRKLLYFSFYYFRFKIYN